MNITCLEAAMMAVRSKCCGDTDALRLWDSIVAAADAYPEENETVITLIRSRDVVTSLFFLKTSEVYLVKCSIDPKSIAIRRGMI